MRLRARTADSLRFCKFYREIARATVLSKIEQIERVHDFSFTGPYVESRKVNRTVVIRINKPDKLNEMNCVRLILAP